MNLKILEIPLQPYSRFHFGEMKLEENVALATTSWHAHSDTLFSALVYAYASYSGDAERFVDRFLNGKIKISSLYYYLESESDKVYFLPKPNFLDINSPKKKDGSHKKRNRIKFVSYEVWKTGFQPELWFQSNSSYRSIQDTFLMTQSEFDQLGLKENTTIARIVSNPKSPIRVSKNQSIFYQADVEVGGDENLQVGWFFGYEAQGEAEKELKTASAIMVLSGIGGEMHNTGRTPKIEKLNLSNHLELDFPNGNKYVNIGLLNPSESDLPKTKYFQTILRGGRFLADGKNAMVVRMIREGALLEDDTIQGQMPELGKDSNGKPVLRNGKPLLIPVNYGKKSKIYRASSRS